MAQKDASVADEVTPKQQVLIAALLTPMSVPDAAKSVGISERTAQYWLRLPQVAAAYRKARRAMFDTMLDTMLENLVRCIPSAMSVLEKHLNANVEATSQTQIKAFQMWSDKLYQQYQAKELAEKLDHIEQLLKEQKTNDKS